MVDHRKLFYGLMDVAMARNVDPATCAILVDHETLRDWAQSDFQLRVCRPDSGSYEGITVEPVKVRNPDNAAPTCTPSLPDTEYVHLTRERPALAPCFALRYADPANGRAVYVDSEVSHAVFTGAK